MRDVFWKRISRLRTVFSKKGLDALWILGPENRRYLSGFSASDIHITESSGSLLIGKDYAFLITDPRYEIQAKEEVPDFEIKLVKDDILDQICRIISETGAKKIGFEENYLSYGTYRKIKEKVSLELIPVEGIVEELRRIKEGCEIELIKKAAKMASEIMDEVISWIRPGISEKEVELRIRELAYRKGAEDLSFQPIVASGKNSALPHASPSEKKLLPHEPIIIDMGVKVEGYCSDITRTVFIDGPDEEFRKIYSVVDEAKKKAISFVKPGMRTDKLDGIARDVIKGAGFGDFFTHGLGHGVGLAVHEAPRISRSDPTILEQGMVITIEPGIYLPGKGGVRIEEMVIVEEGGHEIITKTEYG